MSRIGLTPITLPGGVEVSQKDTVVTVKGPKGSLSQAMDDRFDVSVDDGVVSLARANDETDTKELTDNLYSSEVSDTTLGPIL